MTLIAGYQIEQILACLKVYKACLLLQFWITGNLLDLLMQYQNKDLAAPVLIKAQELSALSSDDS